MIRILKPATGIPNPKKLAGPILDELYEQKKKVTKNLRNCNATLELDGWSTIPNDPVIGMSITTEAGVLLANTIDTIGESHTSDFLFKVLKTEAKKCEEEWGVGVTSVVTDNASNMSRMRQYLSEPLLHAYGCQTHAMNLVAKDANGTAKPDFQRYLHFETSEKPPCWFCRAQNC